MTDVGAISSSEKPPHHGHAFGFSMALMAQSIGDAKAPDDALAHATDVMRQEVDKLAFAAPKSIHWRKILASAHTVLTLYRKDLQVTAYASCAYVGEKGHGGLNEACNLLAAICQSEAAHLYPKRHKARMHAVSWWLDTMQILLADTVCVDASMLAAVDACQKAATRLLGDDTPTFVDLIKNLRDKYTPQKNEAVAAGAEPAPASKSDAPLDTISTVPEFAPIVWGQKLWHAAMARLHDEPLDAMAWRLSREALWLHIQQLEKTPNGTSHIAPLSARLTQQINQALHDQQGEHALMIINRALLHHRLHLDLQRLSAEALLIFTPNRGVEAALAIRHATQALLVRLPELMNFKASDATPLLSQKTKQWLSSPKNLVPILTVVDQPTSGDLSRGPRPVARSERRGGRILFARMLRVAHKAFLDGRIKRAQQIFEVLDSMSTRHDLASWQPSFATEVLLGLVRCGVHLQDNGALHKNNVWVRLAQLDWPRAQATLVD